MTSHRSCTHPATKSARAKCRKARGEGLEKAKKAGEAARAQMDKANTVSVRGKTFVIPQSMAFELRQPAPHPRNIMPGTMAQRMRQRQELRIECAKLLDITLDEVTLVIRQLRRQTILP